MRLLAVGAALLTGAPRFVSGQSSERGAIALGETLDGLGVSARVLMVGAHPDDEDTNLIAWLSRGRHVRTGYLSLTRGDGGQNIIGNELGEALGVIRTEELLAARRIDGGEQYFTRAFDFGFSKDTVDTYRHWPKDSILGDVVRVVRAMRPHVIVAVFSGTPRDGHGQHQVSGLLAREAYDLAADVQRFPVATHGAPWTPLKFYRAARFNPQAGTLSMDVGEYSPLLGRSYAEIAGESRSQHKSQGFGAPQPKGRLLDYLRREASRVNDASPAASERSMFDGIDTSWARFRSVTGTPALVDSLVSDFAAARASVDPFAPQRALPALFGALRWLQSWRLHRDADLAMSVDGAERRVFHAIRLASGVTVDATAPSETLPADTFSVVATIYNRGRDTIRVGRGLVLGLADVALGSGDGPSRVVAPGASLRDTLRSAARGPTQHPWWLVGGRVGGMFSFPTFGAMENARRDTPFAAYVIAVAHHPPILFGATVVDRFVDDVRGEVTRPVAFVPKVTITVDQPVQYVPANVPVQRDVRATLRSEDRRAHDVRLLMQSPLRPDNAAPTVRLEPGADTTLVFRLRGQLAPGPHEIRLVGGGDSVSLGLGGYQIIDYEHIRRTRVYRRPTISLTAVDVRVPDALRVAYVPGVSDNVAPMLAQFGVVVTTIPARELARTDLSRFTTLVLGPRAYEAHSELVAGNGSILEFARRGGTVVVQYGQYEMTQPGIMPHPVTINRPHDRVTHEDAPVTVLDSAARELSWPNRIGADDFAGWVQERALYMPRTFDASYRPLLAMGDPGEPLNRGGILVARVGSGVYVYTSMAFFRQLPAGVPGAARLFVNLLSAGLPATSAR